MRIVSYYKADLTNGPGVRATIFVSGCNHQCKDCFNKELWDFNLGKPFTDELEKEIFDVFDKDYIDGLTVLGGEPLDVKNRDGVAKLCKDFKQRFPNKNVWVWTGYVYENIKDIEALKYIDVLVDGRFIKELKSLGLKWKGSKNQRIIDLVATRENGCLTIIG